MKRQTMGLSLKQMGIYVLFLTAGSIAGWVGGYYLNLENRPANLQLTPRALEIPIEPPASQPLPTPPVSDRNNSNFIAEAVERVGPSVVRIDSSRTIARRMPNSFPDPFRRFFGEDAPAFPERVEGTGSGFILTADGHVVTNAHVVESADRVIVTLKDGREFDGEVVGTDPITDVAAINIQATGLPTVTLGSSETLIPGQWAIAIGNPLGLDNTVTAGIISATDRSSSQVGIDDARRVRFIQTDAAINPGNSGGPLLNDRGEVIGINTAIRANAQGLGFAIPIETVKRVVEQLFTTGEVQHPYLGIVMLDLTPQGRKRINQVGPLGIKIAVDRGALITEVLPNSPAAASGLKPGDVLVKIGGVTVTNGAEVQKQVEASTIGEVLDVEVNRGGQLKAFQVSPSALPTESINFKDD
jgi:S1-C subfamily serine protease